MIIGKNILKNPDGMFGIGNISSLNQFFVLFTYVVLSCVCYIFLYILSSGTHLGVLFITASY